MADADEFDRDENAVDEAPPPTPKNNLLTVVLLLLNVVAALAFVYLVVIDYQKRQDWSYAVFLHDLRGMGLPLEADEAGPTAAREVMPRQRLSDEQLKAAFSQRGGRVSEKFAPVDAALQSTIKPSHMTPEILKDHFGELPAVKTLEEEIRHLHIKVPEAIESAAKEAVAAANAASVADAAAKSKVLERILLSLAYDIYQVEQIDNLIKSAKADTLDAMLLDAAQRRMYVDLLVPLEMHRAGETPTHILQKAANVAGYKLKDETERKAFPLDELKKLLERHLASLAGKLDPVVHPGKEWESTEKRRAIAFFLVDLAFLKKPDGERLYPDGLVRAERVVGLYDLPPAVLSLTSAWMSLDQQVLASIKADREGYEAKSKQDLLSVSGFTGKYQDEVQRLLDVKRQIQQAETRLARLEEQNKAAQTLYNDRVTHMKLVGAKVIEARKKTAEQVEKVRDLQKELFAAQRDLVGVRERNARLEALIRENEGLKGAKAP